ncbi:aspartic proteinase nepenthesin-2 [Selaginella moellendorffii]|nr:aspartic proteinase nepenthesin-2 [Selaginella moellendorffii]|eukprot:XP_002962484.2 aspartic proteinase nepenthesin-2 [Selaginella moellendorffii]
MIPLIIGLLVWMFLGGQIAQSRELLPGDSTGIRLRIVHRSSEESPHWKPEYRDRIQLLDELMAMDRGRIAAFGRVLQEAAQKNSTNSTLPRESTAMIQDFQGEDPALFSRLVSGSSIGSGQYFVELRVGTPAKKFPLIIDTGSDLTWIQCNPPNTTANSSSPPAPWYDKSSSSSYREIPCTDDECLFLPAPIGSSCSIKSPSPCDYTYGYSDQSRTTGILAYETISMKSRKRSGKRAGNHKTRTIRIKNVALGCSRESVGASFLGASGVLGLGQGPISLATQTRHTALGGIFSYCLVDYLRGSNASSFLVMGRTRWRKLAHTPIVRNPAAQSFYYVNVTGVAVDGKPVDGIASSDWGIDGDGNKGTIFDSGTTLSYLREPAYSKVLGALNASIYLPRAQEIPEGFELCYNVTRMEKGMPKLGVEFQGGAVMELPWNNYMVLVAENVQCVALQKVTTTNGSNILGNLLQQDHHIEYDLAKARIGFKWSPCH